jgi:hypothetical protein
MKKIFTGIILIFLAFSGYSQGAPYITSEGELILGFARIQNNGVDQSSIPRFTCFFHGQSLIHFDKSEGFGLFSGISIRNVGFIYDESASVRKKYRTYNVGIPLGIKIGDLDNLYIYGGYELELPINYKEKTFINEKKEDKFNVWFSNRTPAIYNTFFVGVRLPHGLSLKFKYYATPFFNQNYSQSVNGVTVKPFENLNVNTFHFSLTTIISHGKEVVMIKR